MARSAIGFFGIFGRSSDLRQLDDALRSVDVHPRMVAEAVKLTTVRLLEEHLGREPGPPDYRRAAERIEEALADGEGIDSQLILLAIHARFIEASVVDRFGLESSE
jgi:hypothetical protein